MKNEYQYDARRQAPTHEQLRLEGHNSNLYEVCSPTYEQLNMEDQNENMYDSCSPAYEEFSSGYQNQQGPILIALLPQYIENKKEVILQQFQVDISV